MSIAADVKQARSDAFREAKAAGLPWVFSRGAQIATVDAIGNQCEPWPSADALAWDGKIGSLSQRIAEAKAHPEVWQVVVEGGYDGADTMEDKKSGNYEPWIASWQVVIWDRRMEAA